MSGSVTVSICHADEVHVPPARGIGGVAVERAVLRVDVELDAPTSSRHGEVDPRRKAARRADDADLRLDRDAAPPQRVGEHDLRVGLAGS